MEDLYNWLDYNHIQYRQHSDLITIDGKEYRVIDPPVLFDKDLKLMGKDTYEPADRYIFNTGGQFYYTPADADTIQFNILKYIGKYESKLDVSNTPHLGVHGGYELMNGSGDYKDWVRKAKFLGIDTLGIVEKNTLSGVMAFQTECKDAGVASVIGATYQVLMPAKISGNPDTPIDIKFYVMNDTGWRNILIFNSKINVDGVDIMLEDLRGHTDGLMMVIPYGYMLTDVIASTFKDLCSHVFYQLDSVRYSNMDRDMEALKALKVYLTKYYPIKSKHHIPVVLINDSYYLDKDYSHIKKKLNDAVKRFCIDSDNQHFKSIDETFDTISRLFGEDDDRLYDIIGIACNNANEIATACTFNIITGVFFMPKFDQTRIDAPVSLSLSNEDLFWSLISDGFVRKLGDRTIDATRQDEYVSRIETECEVIMEGGFVDYFLILWDIVRWSHINGILTGIGRGSAGGSLVSYLLGITQLDPIKYNLLFERFLNKGRIGKSLPDIDVDFEGDRRGEVKRYISRVYGNDNVCSIGTFSKLKIKAAMKELGQNVDYSTINFMTSQIIDREGDWEEVFRSALRSIPLKKFVSNNVNLINDIRIIIGQPKNESIHACATLIIPQKDNMGNDRNLFSWIPIRKIGDDYVSEWEGEYLDKAGFLKEDILGISRLDKFRHIINLIKGNTGEDIDIYSIPVDDDDVYKLFKLGMNEDVFHFHTPGMVRMSKELLPNKIGDLIDMNALHRPAAMEVGSHTEYLSVRNGLKQPKFDWGLKDTVKDTNGILLYQEQVMEAVSVLGGFTLTEADDIRKAMGKKKPEIIEPYKNQFIDNAIKIGCPDEEAAKIWHKLEVFAGYGFNRSHAAAYAITGYISQWFKVKYPIHFWTSALQFADDKEIPGFISEMNSLSKLEWYKNKVNYTYPDINKSGDKFVAIYNENTIYWSLLKLKEVGAVAVKEIMEVRESGGAFYSISDFFMRVNRKRVNKKVIDSLIFSGCFDSIYNMKSVKDRRQIFEEYCNVSKVKSEAYDDVFVGISDYTFWWAIQQRRVSGIGFVDYADLVSWVKFAGRGKYVTPDKIYDKYFVSWCEGFLNYVTVAGIIVAVDVHKPRGKSGKDFANVQIDTNGSLRWITMWSEIWSVYSGKIQQGIGAILIINGKVREDKWKKENVVETDSQTKLMITVI